MWWNDNGCGGYYLGGNPQEMYCKGTATDIYGHRVAIRQGFWNGYYGFGWSKAYDYHNLWMQPMLDTITWSTNTSSSLSSENYILYHYANGNLDQEVVVVADLVDPSFGGVGTQDGRALGVVTGHCLGGNGYEETTCPDWVDTSL